MNKYVLIVLLLASPLFAQTASINGVANQTLVGPSALQASSAYGSLAMATWLEALHNSSNTPASLKNFGDSFSIASQQNSTVGPALTSDLWIEQVRAALQSKYGSHGTGIAPIVLAAGTANVNPTLWAITGTNSVITTLGPEQGASVPGGSLYQLGTGAVLTFHDTRGIAWDTFHLYYATSAGSGNLALFSTDLSTSLGTANAGSAAATGAVNGGLTASRFDASAIASGTHTITITCSASPCYVWGAQGTAGTSGVEVSNIGIGSAAAEMFASLSTANQMAFTDLDPVGTQGVTTMLQTNEPGVGYSTSSFNTAMTAIVSHERGLSAANPASVLLIIPPQGSIGTGTLPAYTAVQVALCGSLTVNCQNVQDRWSATFSSTTGLWSNDASCAYCHPTTKGDLDMGTVAYAGLIQPNPTSASSSTAFSAVTAGTNTGALLMGSGGSLAPTGTGTIQANNISGTLAATSPLTLTGSGTPASPYTYACPTCGTSSGGTNVSQNSGSTETNLPITGYMPQVCSDTSGSGTAQSCTVANSFTPQTGNCVVYKTTTANSGTGLTINLNSLGAKSVAVGGSSGWTTTLVASNSIPANKPMNLCYDGTNWNASGTGYVPPSGGGSTSSLPKPAAVGSWTWMNQGTATTSNNGGVLAMTILDTGSSLNWRVLTQTTASTPYSYAFYWKSIQFFANSTVTGIYLTDGTKLLGIEVLTGTGAKTLRVERINSVTSDNSTVKSSALTNGFISDPLTGGFYGRWRNDGSTLYADFSPDGVNWTNYYSEAVGAFLTPNAIGFGGVCVTSGAVPYTVTSLQGFLYTASGSL